MTPHFPQEKITRSTRTRFLAAHTLSAWAAFLVAILLATQATEAQTPERKTYERIVDDKETGKLILQFPVRRFERKDRSGPVVTTHAMIHIADRSFYERHQVLLDPLDVVLFEVVLPAGTGRPEYSLQDTNSAQWKIDTTKMRLHSLAMHARGYAVENGKLPTKFDDILKQYDDLRPFADRLSKDAWGNEFEFSVIEREQTEDEDSEASPKRGPNEILEIISLGADEAEGGVGEDADIRLSEQPPMIMGNSDPNSMPRIAEYLGLIFQGRVEKHNKANWRSSDLSDDQVNERFAAEGMPEEQKKNADPWMPARVLETISELSQTIPGLKNAGKAFFIDILGASPIQLQESSNDPFAKVIIKDRNQVVISDLRAILEKEPEVKSIGIIYGAAHMPDIESQLIEMGYEETRTDWLDAITTALPEDLAERKQLEISRSTVRTMGLLGGTESQGQGKRKRWRKSNTSEETLAQGYRKEVLRGWVGELAKSLDADREVERDTAEKDLMALGSLAIPYLPASSDDDSDEFRIRLDRIRGTLLERDKAIVSKPARVNIVGKMIGKEALESLAEQSGNTLQLANVPRLDTQIDLELEDMLYWEALDEILDKLSLTIVPNDGDDLRLIARNEFMPQRFVMASYSGSFRLEPIAVTKEQRQYEPDLNATSIELSLSWEPRLNPVFIRYELEGLELKCDNGEILRPKKDQGTDFTTSGSQLTSLIQFDRPSRSAKEITEWRGNFLCVMPGKPVAISFKDLDTAKNVTSSNGDLQVTLERSRKNRDVYEILVGVALRGEQSTDSMQGWTSMIDAYLEDDKGNRLQHAGWSTNRITDQDVGLAFLFEVEESLAGYRFVFIAPQSIMQQSVEYSLGGIALP